MAQEAKDVEAPKDWRGLLADYRKENGIEGEEWGRFLSQHYKVETEPELVQGLLPHEWGPLTKERVEELAAQKIKNDKLFASHVEASFELWKLDRGDVTNEKLPSIKLFTNESRIKKLSEEEAAAVRKLAEVWGQKNAVSYVTLGIVKNSANRDELYSFTFDLKGGEHITVTVGGLRQGIKGIFPNKDEAGRDKDGIKFTPGNEKGTSIKSQDPPSEIREAFGRMIIDGKKFDSSPDIIKERVKK